MREHNNLSDHARRSLKFVKLDNISTSESHKKYLARNSRNFTSLIVGYNNFEKKYPLIRKLIPINSLSFHSKWILNEISKNYK